MVAGAGGLAFLIPQTAILYSSQVPCGIDSSKGCEGQLEKLQVHKQQKEDEGKCRPAAEWQTW